MKKSEMTPLELHKRGQTFKHVGKGATEQILPHRHAMSTLTKGDPLHRTMQNYAKATPMMNPLSESDYGV